MVWDSANANAILTQARVQLAACAAWTTEVGSGNELAHIHFPMANPGGENGSTPDPLSLIVLVQTDSSFQRFAEGAGGLPRGSLDFDLYVAMTVGATQKTTAYIESLADTLITQLMQQAPGIPFIGSISRGMARDVKPGQIAADSVSTPAAFRIITIKAPYGLNP